jgi:hypothetical protein
MAINEERSMKGFDEAAIAKSKAFKRKLNFHMSKDEKNVAPKPKKKSRAENASPFADFEQTLANAAVSANAVEAFTSPVHVTYRSLRHRLADNDNLIGKGILDGIVKAGLLPSDQAEQVTEVAHRQVKIGTKDEEVTEVVIEEI